MTPVRIMLFDLDGTLIDSLTDIATSVNRMLAELDRPAVDESAVARFVGDGVRVLVYRALTATEPAHRPPDDNLHADGLALMRKHYSHQMLAATRLYPGVSETLQHFGNKPKAIVTSKETEFTRTIINHLGIAHHFECVVGGDTIPERKPDPRPVLEAIIQLGGSPDEAVMIGDSENDIAAGSRAGARTCGVTYGFRSAEQLKLAAPDFTIDQFASLTTLFE
ncbi:MAG: phosphoglycolate phosphatase [Blastocatellia bacterium AA13]|nr:MAG: phosphoglycolate phosphatase [Blastocatellia bacterium AA13]